MAEERTGGWVIGLLGVALAGAGCGGGDAPRPAASAPGEPRDSAGVAIVESREARWPEGGGWRIESVPALDIGGEDAGVAYQFTTVAGLARLADGTWFVADGGASEVRLYDASGRLIRASGRPGDGPGEFRSINAIGVGPGDTLWVFDFGLRRFTLLGSDLLVRRTVTLAALSAVGAVGMSPDGGFLVREYFSVAAGGPLGLRRDPTAVVRLGASGAVRDTIALVPGREVVIGSEGGRAVMTAPVVARTTAVAFAGDAVLVGDAATYEVRRYDLDGRLRRIVRRPDVDLTLKPADRDRLIDRRVARVPAEQRAGARARLSELPTPPSRPAFGAMLADDAGWLWVADWTTDEVPSRWAVFDPDGRYLGDLTMPPGFEPRWLGADLVAGVQRDELGVERVRAYVVDRE